VLEQLRCVKHEFVTLEGMEKAVQVIVRIAELTAKR
jgi:tripeptide aminopeptidase